MLQHPIDSVIGQFADRQSAWMFDIQEALRREYGTIYGKPYPQHAFNEVCTKLRQRGVIVHNSID